MSPRFTAAACVLAIVGSAQAAAIPGQGTWETTLQPRDLDGAAWSIEAYYDTDLGITWLTNTDAGSGRMQWDQARSWATGLSLDGVTGWRLPWVNNFNVSVPPNCNLGQWCGVNADPDSSELAHIFFVTLGNTPDSVTAKNSGPFVNFYTSYYWAGREYDADPTSAWSFSLYDGQGVWGKGSPMYAWAVHDGDIGIPVPEPSTWLLLSSGLLALVGRGLVKRRALSVEHGWSRLDALQARSV